MYQFKKYLAIDYGTVRVGLAISHGSLAEPLKVLANDDELIANIILIVNAERIEAIVVGISENEMAEKTFAFIEDLRKSTDLEIILADETLSSKTVQEKLRSAKKSKRSGDIDHYAAAVFLQEFLDTEAID